MSPKYRAWVLEQLRHVGTVTGRSMFGGYGLYLDGAFFALIFDDTLFFKVDDSTRGPYQAAGMQPFRPYQDQRTMQYYEVPADVLEDAERLREWAERSASIARKQRKGTKKR